MRQSKLIGLGFIVIGAIVLFFGYNASQSVAEQVTETLTGQFTDETMLYFLGGAILVVIGLIFVVRK